MQADLISHVMQHFLGDKLSAVLFDALSPLSQLRLAREMLVASQWMTPKGWRHWVKHGRDLAYAQRLKAASDLSFATAGAIAGGIVAMACWQIIAWIGYGYSWYFASTHFLGTWPGWLKAVVIVSAIVFCVIGLVQTDYLGIAVAIIGVIAVFVSVLASPVVRIHIWITSWGTASTIIICALIFSALLAWLGISYSDSRHTKEPVQLSTVVRGRFSQISRRSRFRPDHKVGHDEWCTARDGIP
jgi:hypothetical protein